jgi:hypothetical protein
MSEKPRQEPQRGAGRRPERAPAERYRKPELKRYGRLEPRLQFGSQPPFP